MVCWKNLEYRVIHHRENWLQAVIIRRLLSRGSLVCLGRGVVAVARSYPGLSWESWDWRVRPNPPLNENVWKGTIGGMRT